jgi:hypothetical protein
MSSETRSDGDTAVQVDDFLSGVGERLGSVVAVAGRTVKRWGENLVNGDRSPRERAEAIVTGIEEQLGDYTASVGYGIRRVAARAKEEFDDIRAEAELKKEEWTSVTPEKPAGEGEIPTNQG